MCLFDGHTSPPPPIKNKNKNKRASDKKSDLLGRMYKKAKKKKGFKGFKRSNVLMKSDPIDEID